MLVITPIFAALLTFLYVVLSVRVVRHRRGNGISLGLQDDDTLLLRTRAHGNFAEYAPIGLILLACMELQGAPNIAVIVLGLLLLIGRVSHAVALWENPQKMKFRVLGMVCTFAMLNFTAAGLLLHALF